LLQSLFSDLRGPNIDGRYDVTSVELAEGAGVDDQNLIITQFNISNNDKSLRVFQIM